MSCPAEGDREGCLGGLERPCLESADLEAERLALLCFGFGGLLASALEKQETTLSE